MKKSKNKKDSEQVEGRRCDNNIRRAVFSGIDKKYKHTYGNNRYDTEYDRLVKIRFNKAKSHNYKDIIAACVQAFKEIEIEVYTEEDSADGTD